MNETPFILRGRRVLTPRGLAPAALHVADGRIAAISPYEADTDDDDFPRDLPRVEVGELTLMPGLVDTHVHVNDPGRSEWEGFETATRAAAAGGVTTLVDMPLNSRPATTTPEALAVKRRAAAGRCRVDVGFWGGAVPGNQRWLRPLAEAGVLGFKAFLSPSGVEEFPAIGGEELDRAFHELAGLGRPLLVHAEDPGVLARNCDALAAAPRSYAAYLASRPPAAEVAAIADLLERLRRLRQEGRELHLHVVHLATAEALPLLRAARREGLAVTVETCPHYLTFAAEEIPDGATIFQCAPPIRGAAEREALWRALADGEIDLVASDHSPCPPDLKGLGSPEACFRTAWGGIASLQLTLPAVWTGARRRGLDVADVSRWLSAAPARLAGLSGLEGRGGRKGVLDVGYDADFVLWDPERSFRVRADDLEFRHKATPNEGMELYGVVAATYLRGRRIYSRDDGDPFAGRPGGRLLEPT